MKDFFKKNSEKSQETAADTVEHAAAAHDYAQQLNESEQASDNGQTPLTENSRDGAEKANACCAELEACKAELASYKNQFLRTRADLENQTRRMEKERLQFVSMGQRAVLLDLLSIVDDFDRALADHSKQTEVVSSPEEKLSAADVAQDRQVWLAGFSLIRSGLYKMLEKYGVKPMTATQYAVFDPQLHEAIMQVESETHQSGEIAQVLLPGFMLGDQVLRPAQVSVAK
ncbi:nucleotide exchange factor GrpE [Candidatus Dependentiae bacterium HGW-Dependentiae-1]|nr:MAG: nucleotide exchange factor GrpE [Candidatus Dependentiae bacterium HGW-Dependentiae-1]